MSRATILLAMLVFTTACTEPEMSNEKRLHLIISKAKKLEDYQTTISATYQLMSSDTNELSYYDSLAVYYYRQNNFVSCLATSKYLLEYRTNAQILSMAAKSSIALGQVDGSVKYMEAVLEIEPESLEWSYQLSQAYFTLNRGYECQKTLQTLIAQPLSKVELTQVTHKNQLYSIPYYTASLNLLGALLANTGQPKEAEKHFVEAIRFSPGFPLPKENLEMLKPVK